MSAHHQIFLHAARNVPAICADVSRVIGVSSLDPVESLDRFESFRGAADRTVVELEVGHPYEVDRDLRFEDYPILVTVRSLDRDLEFERRVARRIGAALNDTGDYAVLVVFDLQHQVWASS